MIMKSNRYEDLCLELECGKDNFPHTLCICLSWGLLRDSSLCQLFISIDTSYFNKMIPVASIILKFLQGKDLYLADNVKLSNSWNEYIISLRSSYVNLRNYSNFDVESYNHISFSRQFSFCQDVSGDLMDRPYDGTLLKLVQLLNSSFKHNTFLKSCSQRAH